MFKKGKVEGVKEKLEGYTKLAKTEIEPGEGVLIDNVVKGFSEENGDFIIVTGSYKAKPVFVSVPAASREDFMEITPADLDTIRSQGLRFYVESRTSKKGRQYFVAWIDD